MNVTVRCAVYVAAGTPADDRLQLLQAIKLTSPLLVTGLPVLPVFFPWQLWLWLV